MKVLCDLGICEEQTETTKSSANAEQKDILMPKSALAKEMKSSSSTSRFGNMERMDSYYRIAPEAGLVIGFKLLKMAVECVRRAKEMLSRKKEMLEQMGKGMAQQQNQNAGTVIGGNTNLNNDQQRDLNIQKLIQEYETLFWYVEEKRLEKLSSGTNDGLMAGAVTAVAIGAKGMQSKGQATGGKAIAMGTTAATTQTTIGKNGKPLKGAPQQQSALKGVKPASKMNMKNNMGKNDQGKPTNPSASNQSAMLTYICEAGCDESLIGLPPKNSSSSSKKIDVSQVRRKKYSQLDVMKFTIDFSTGQYRCPDCKRSFMITEKELYEREKKREQAEARALGARIAESGSLDGNASGSGSESGQLTLAQQKLEQQMKANAKLTELEVFDLFCGVLFRQYFKRGSVIYGCVLPRFPLLKRVRGGGENANVVNPLFGVANQIPGQQPAAPSSSAISSDQDLMNHLTQKSRREQLLLANKNVRLVDKKSQPWFVVTGENETDTAIEDHASAMLENSLNDSDRIRSYGNNAGSSQYDCLFQKGSSSSSSSLGGAPSSSSANVKSAGPSSSSAALSVMNNSTNIIPSFEDLVRDFLDNSGTNTADLLERMAIPENERGGLLNRVMQEADRCRDAGRDSTHRSSHRRSRSPRRDRDGGRDTNIPLQDKNLSASEMSAIREQNRIRLMKAGAFSKAGSGKGISSSANQNLNPSDPEYQTKQKVREILDTKVCYMGRGKSKTQSNSNSKTKKVNVIKSIPLRDVTKKIENRMTDSQFDEYFALRDKAMSIWYGYHVTFSNI